MRKMEGLEDRGCHGLTGCCFDCQASRCLLMGWRLMPEGLHQACHAIVGFRSPKEDWNDQVALKPFSQLLVQRVGRRLLILQELLKQIVIEICKALHQQPTSLGLPLPVVVRHLRSEEHTSELQSRPHLVCRLLLEKKKK